MSDTPRTDEAAEMLPIYGPSDSEWVNADFARQLERENARLVGSIRNAKAYAQRVEALAFKMPPPNAYTPIFVQEAMAVQSWADSILSELGELK